MTGPIASSRTNDGGKIDVYPDRIEYSRPRALTLWITKKREVYPYRSIRDITQSGKHVAVHMGPLSVRHYYVNRKTGRALLEAFTAWK